MAMTKEELKIIIEEGEGYRIEFKERVSDLDREMVAFANASGGRIFLGISDEGMVKGNVIVEIFENRLRLIRVNPYITREELADKIGITTGGIKYHMEKLRKEEKLRHSGPTKKGKWEVLHG